MQNDLAGHIGIKPTQSQSTNRAPALPKQGQPEFMATLESIDLPKTAQASPQLKGQDVPLGELKLEEKALQFPSPDLPIQEGSEKNSPENIMIEPAQAPSGPAQANLAAVILPVSDPVETTQATLPIQRVTPGDVNLKDVSISQPVQDKNTVDKQIVTPEIPLPVSPKPERSGKTVVSDFIGIPTRELPISKPDHAPVIRPEPVRVGPGGVMSPDWQAFPVSDRAASPTRTHVIADIDTGLITRPTPTADKQPTENLSLFRPEVTPNGEFHRALVLRDSGFLHSATLDSGRMETPPSLQQSKLAAHNIAVQMTRMISATGDPRIELRLDPPELGRVVLNLTPSEHSVAVSVTAERPEIIDLMRRHMDVLADALERAGYSNPDLDFQSEFQSGPDQDDSDSLHPVQDLTEAPDTSQITVQALTLDGTLDIRL